MTDIIIAGFLGFLLGGFVMAFCLTKDVDRIWDGAFEAGEQYGAESERIRQALGEKEQVVFSKLVVDHATGEAHCEVSGDADGA